MVMFKAQMAASGTGKAISSVAASFGSPNVHTVDCASFQPLRASTTSPGWFLGFTSALPQF